ncbi:Membrane protein of unknown function [Alteracholeplasma palmae J233]|uniref:Uncharacterized protein n=1 Tax=Alteracholeplasma palmae (strain ATCC 49389 / J233) TaxID=1318466 RepID=U4KNF1_ALTPJ|nr:phage holin family protein [Alteracholeplasma palmae]CCV63710.1 Membrane protein of unknown function [Alteracholeplasma palmae J233]
MKNDDDEKKELTQEEIEELLNTLKDKNANNTGTILNFGLLLHPKMTVHLIVTWIINLLVFAVVSGILNQISPTIYFNLTSYLLGVSLFTLIEFVFKIIFLKFFLRIVLMSFGMILYVIQVACFYLVDLVVPNFDFYTIEGVFIFTICFSIVRLIISRYIRKYRILNRF